MYFSSANVAHAGDKDYHRLEVELGDDKLGNVEVRRIKIMMDEFLEQERAEQNSTVGYTGVKEYFFEKINNLFGSPGLPADMREDIIPKNIGAAVENFFSKINMLAATPESHSVKVAVVNSADHLSANLSNIAYKLQNLRLQADEMIEKSCNSINENLKILHNANSELLHSRSYEGAKVRLESSRMQVLHSPSEYIDISTNTDKEGRIHIYTTDGKEVAGDYLSKFQHKALPNVDMIIEGQEFNLLFLSSGKQITGIDTGKLASGKIKGLTELRDIDILKILFLIDELAHNMSVQINKIHSTGNNFPGHNELISQSDVSDIKFTGEVKLALLD